MSVVNREYFDKIIQLVLKDAEHARINAGYSGRWDDGGANKFEEQVKFFQYGLNATLPPEWKQYELLLDPEYNEYLRLHKKFNS